MKMRKRKREELREVYIGAYRPDPGTRVEIMQDEGPPGYEETGGWLGCVGTVIFSDTNEEERDGVEAVRVHFEIGEHPLEYLLEQSGHENQGLSLLWAPDSVRRVT